MATTKQTKKAAVKKTSAKTSKVSKSQVTKQTASLVEDINENLISAQGVVKQVWFAGLGLMGRSVDEFQDRATKATEELQNRYSKINKEGEKLVKDLVQRGEKVQDQAEELISERRANIEEQIEAAKSRLSGFVSVVDIPTRLQDMSDRLEGLSRDLKKSA